MVPGGGVLLLFLLKKSPVSLPHVIFGGLALQACWRAGKEHNEICTRPHLHSKQRCLHTRRDIELKTKKMERNVSER